MFLSFTIIILFHELGHIIAGLICKWKIEKIVILPFGGLTIFNQKINHSLNEELFVTLLGPIFQIIFSFFISKDMMNIHYSLLLFNMLPIYPLDGSKIVNVFINKKCPFLKSQKLIILISYMTIILILIIGLIKHLNILFILILVLILKKVIQNHTQLKETFNKFLLERYLYKFRYKKTKNITNIKNMYLNKNHVFKIDNNYYTEREILSKLFDK